MIISHRKKYVYFHIPKTGGTAIRTCFKQFSSKLLVDEIGYWEGIVKQRDSTKYPLVNFDLYLHANNKQVGNYLDETGKQSKDYFKFAFIRNPWDLEVSRYKYWQQYMPKSLNPDPRMLNIALSGNFDIWCERLSYGHAQYIQTFIKDLDFIGKFENLESDFYLVIKRLFPDLDSNMLKIHNMNRTVRKPYQEYYQNENTKEIIRKAYKNVIKLGGYEF
jgi:hypothetical protein